MYRVFAGVVIFCAFIACNNSNHPLAAAKSADSSTVAHANMAPQTACYAYMQNGDTIRLQITITDDNTFSGHMLYQLKEKDRNNGTLQGTISGDTLIADYHFASEGMMSVRQVAFLKQENSLKEGFAELTIKDNNWVFKNPHSLQFTGFLLLPSECE